MKRTERMGPLPCADDDGQRHDLYIDQDFVAGVETNRTYRTAEGLVVTRVAGGEFEITATGQRIRVVVATPPKL